MRIRFVYCIPDKQFKTNQTSGSSRQAFWNCWDLPFPSIKIETLDRDHVETNRDPQAYDFCIFLVKISQFVETSHHFYTENVLIMSRFFEKSWFASTNLDNLDSSWQSWRSWQLKNLNLKISISTVKTPRLSQITTEFSKCLHRNFCKKWNKGISMPFPKM